MNALAEELAAIDLGDARLNRRARRTLEKLGAHPMQSIPTACGGWAETLAAYRLFDHPQVTAQAVLEPHYACTEQRMREYSVVLCIQDTTEGDYSGKNDIVGLGPLNYETRRGLYLHPTLAVTPERVPLGAAGPSRKKRACVGWRVIDASRSSSSPCPRPSWSMSPTARPATSTPVLAEAEFDLPATARRPARRIHQQLRVARLTFKAPHRSDRTLADIEVSAVLAREVDPPQGEEPIEWLLLTSLPVETAEQALEKLQWYLCRWQIEVFFKILKSGCRIEKLQLETLERLEPALAFYLIIAWRVLYLTLLGRDCPQMPCNVVFAEEEWRAVYIVTKRQPPPETPPSLDAMVRMVASFGGFLNRKGDGFPGPQSLWIGLQRTRDFVLAMDAQRASQSPRCV